MKTIEQIKNEIATEFDATDTLDLPESVFGGKRFVVQYNKYLANRIQADIDAELTTLGNELVTRTDIYDFPLEVPGGKLLPKEKF